MPINCVTEHSIPFVLHYVPMPQNYYFFHVLTVSLITAKCAN